MRLHNSDVSIKSLALNALVKLSVRFTTSTAAIGQLLQMHSSSMNLELQQRSVEYSKLLGAQWDGLRGNLLGNMPVIDEASLRKKRMTEEANRMEMNGGITDHVPLATPSGGGNSGSGGLLDLDDIFGGGGGGGPVTAAPAGGLGGADLLGSGSMPTSNTAPAASSGGGDLLSDIFSASVNVSPAPAASTAPMTDPFGCFSPTGPYPSQRWDGSPWHTHACSCSCPCCRRRPIGPKHHSLRERRPEGAVRT